MTLEYKIFVYQSAEHNIKIFKN